MGGALYACVRAARLLASSLKRATAGTRLRLAGSSSSFVCSIHAGGHFSAGCDACVLSEVRAASCPASASPTALHRHRRRHAQRARMDVPVTLFDWSAPLFLAIFRGMPTANAEG